MVANYVASDALCVEVCPLGWTNSDQSAQGTEGAFGNRPVGVSSSYLGFRKFNYLQGAAFPACFPCNSEIGQFGSSPGVCSICPEPNQIPDGLWASINHRSKGNGVVSTSCVYKCPYPFISRWRGALSYHCSPDDWVQGSVCVGASPAVANALSAVLPSLYVITMLVFLLYRPKASRFSAKYAPAPGADLKKDADELSSSAPTSVETAVPTLEDGGGGETPEAFSGEERQEHKEEGGPVVMASASSSLRLLVGLLLYTTLPLIDNLTDFLFIISNVFYNFPILIGFAFFFILPNLLFFKLLREKKAYPRLYLLPMPACLLLDSYNTRLKRLQGILLAAPFYLVNSPVLLPQLLIGFFFYSTKAFSVKQVANLWLQLWTGDLFGKDGTEAAARRDAMNADAARRPIDEQVLNESVLAHTVLETFPLLLFSVVNNSYLGTWNTLSIVSISFSVFNAVSGIWRYVYFRLYLGIDMSDIPIDFSVFGIDVYGNDVMKEETAKEQKALNEKLAEKENGVVISGSNSVGGDVASSSSSEDINSNSAVLCGDGDALQLLSEKRSRVVEAVSLLRANVSLRLDQVLAQLASSSSSPPPHMEGSGDGGGGGDNVAEQRLLALLAGGAEVFKEDENPLEALDELKDAEAAWWAEVLRRANAIEADIDGMQ